MWDRFDAVLGLGLLARADAEPEARDDDAEIRQSLSVLLQRAGWQVETFGDAKAGLHMVQSGHLPDRLYSG